MEKTIQAKEIKHLSVRILILQSALYYRYFEHNGETRGASNG